MKFLRNGFKKGGIKLPENKETTNTIKITNASIPNRVRIPMLQHIGKPAIPCVKIGDLVKEGQLIGTADGDLSANVHASIPGKVTAIGELFVPTAQRSVYVEIEFGGSFTKWEKKNEKWDMFSPQELLKRIKDAGIVGMGGGAFPTHIKLKPSKPIQTIIINGTECEPYLTADERLMEEKAVEIREGIKILKRILNPRRIVVGIEDNKDSAIEALTKVAGKDFEVFSVDTRYPQGSEKQLIEAILDQELPRNTLPFEIGTVIFNVGTVFAIYEAIVYEKPLFERIVTLTGQLVKWPGNYKVRLGMELSALLQDKVFSEPAKIVIGGPMMGVAQFTVNTPIIKGSSGILVFSKEEVKYKKERPCIRCGRCMGVCPMGLFPNMMFSYIQVNDLDNAKKIGVEDCIECGACSYVCPSKIQLVRYFKSAKINLKANRLFALNKTPVIKGLKYGKE